MLSLLPCVTKSGTCAVIDCLRISTVVAADVKSDTATSAPSAPADDSAASPSFDHVGNTTLTEPFCAGCMFTIAGATAALLN